MEPNKYLGSIFSLSGKRILLTGASSGLGREFAPILANAGAHVILAARSVDKMESIKEEIAGFCKKGGACSLCKKGHIERQ